MTGSSDSNSFRRSAGVAKLVVSPSSPPLRAPALGADSAAASVASAVALVVGLAVIWPQICFTFKKKKSHLTVKIRTKQSILWTNHRRSISSTSSAPGGQKTNYRRKRNRGLVTCPPFLPCLAAKHGTNRWSCTIIKTTDRLDWLMDERKRRSSSHSKWRR